MELQRLAHELEHTQREHKYVAQQKDEMGTKMEQIKKEFEREQKEWYVVCCIAESGAGCSPTCPLLHCTSTCLMSKLHWAVHVPF